MSSQKRKIMQIGFPQKGSRRVAEIERSSRANTDFCSHFKQGGVNNSEA